MCLYSLPVIAHKVADLNSSFNKTSNASQALSNLLIALLFISSQFLQENDEEARGIAKEGQLMARELLQPHRLYCYYYKVLEVSTVDPFYYFPQLLLVLQTSYSIKSRHGSYYSRISVKNFSKTYFIN